MAVLPPLKQDEPLTPQRSAIGLVFLFVAIVLVVTFGYVLMRIL